MSLLCHAMSSSRSLHITYSLLFLFACITWAQAQSEASTVDSILEIARSHRGENLKKHHSYKARIRETCRAQVQAIPFDIWPLSGVVVPAKKDIGIAYYSEALIEARYGDNLHYRQNVLIKREAGKLPIPNWQQLPAYDFNLLQERIYLNEAFDRGFVSPLSEEGRNMYHFQLDSIDSIAQVALIHFKPRRERFPALSGKVLLKLPEGLPLEAEFNISANNQLELMDSIAVRQIFNFEDGLYQAEKQEIELHLNLFGYQGYYLVSHKYDHFRYIQNWETSEFDDLVFELKEKHFNSDTSYWGIYQRDPKVEEYFETYSINSELKNQFRTFGSSRLDPGPYRFYKNLYRGYTRRYGHWFWDLPPIYKGLGFNPVEGAYWRGQTRFGYAKDNKEINMRFQGRIGTADQRFKPVAEFNWQSDINYPLNFSLELGTDYQQFNEEQPILPVLNTAYNLLLAQNFINLYGKDYLKLRYQGESMSGLALGVEMEYAWRYPIFNNTTFNFIDDDRIFESNNQGFAPNINPGGFRAHNSMRFDISLSYQFSDRYEMRYNQRFQDVLKGRKNLVVRAPKIYYDLKVGLPSFGAETDFIYHSLGVQHQFRWGNIGLSQFDISGGHFLRRNNVPFIDYTHFDGVQIFFLQPSTDRSARIKQFSTLPYYTYSTTEAFLELHYEHNFDGALLSNNNFLRRYKIHSLVGFNSLHIQNDRDFIEVFFGFDNIFKILRIEFAGGLDNFRRLRPSLRIGFDFRYDYYQRNRR